MLSALIRPSLIATLCLAAAPVLAEGLATSASSAGSSASSAGSASLRGSSDSIKGSSDSSSGGDQTAVADGDYRVAAVDAVEGRPDMMRLTMEPLATEAPANRFQLDLPARALGDQPIVTGDTVAARNRPYGLEFARGERHQAFFLVLADDWNRDLDTRPLVR